METAMALDAATSESFMTMLRRLRFARGFTQASLAKRLKVTPSTVSLWESGSALPSPTRVQALADALAIDPMDLTRVICPEPKPIHVS
jgi:transcriptional regulator with XRE-family HTH domain